MACNTIVLGISLYILTKHVLPQTILQTAEGKIRGNLETSTRGETTYAIFYGVPYAKPPIGNLRFKSPQPMDSWDGVFDNYLSMKSACPQFNALPIEVVREDCLYLNIATPAVKEGEINPDAKLAVMVWLYGGSWIEGSNNPILYNPDFFMDHGVVFVGVNYRLGALGFFALENQAFGNQGLRDQAIALDWVQNNIQYFGGDSDRVTIFGESAGSWSVFYHTLSPHTTGLFHRAIAQSGANLGPGLNNYPRTQEKAFQLGLDLGARVGCYPTKEDFRNEELLECLQNIEDPFDILNADDYGTSYANIDTILGAEAFLPDNPRRILESGAMNEVDLIIGANQDEGLEAIIPLLMDPGNDTLYAAIRSDWASKGPYMIFDQHEGEVTEEAIALSDTVAEFYLPGGIQSFNFASLGGIVDMFSDAWYWYTTHDWARLTVQNNLTTYRYINSYDSLYGLLLISGVPNIEDYGVCHGDELMLLFGGTLSSVLPAGDKKVSQDLVRWWTNFAKYG